MTKSPLTKSPIAESSLSNCEDRASNCGPLLVTSFRAWRSHQPSNASHDLLAAMQQAGQLPNNTIWLANLPVSFKIAPIRVINAMYRFAPRAIVCCGMAENRPLLSLERQARGTSQTLQTSFDLHSLLQGTHLSEISDDAGSYVCNALYYYVLEAIQNRARSNPLRSNRVIPCLFIHVPLLNKKTQTFVQADLFSVLNKISG